MSPEETDRVIHIRFHARGGQGGVTAAQLVVEAFNGMGRAQPKFGAERMGSPKMKYIHLNSWLYLIKHSSLKWMSLQECHREEPY